MIYFKMEIGVPQEVTILRGNAEGTFSKYATIEEAEKIAKNEADKAVANQKFKTVNGNDIRGEGNIEIKAGVTSVNGMEGDVVIDIPSKVSELENDANYATRSEIPTRVSQLENDSNYATQSEIPTTTSQLTNNSGFITIADVPTRVSQLENDANYATKSELPTTTSELTNNSGFITIADVPTKVSELENDAQYVTKSEVPSLTDVPTKLSQLQNDARYVNDISKETNGILHLWSGSQAEYDALQNKESKTLYVII